MNIKVSSFQSIGTAELDASGLTVVVGPSDRGKSALLRAIEAALFNRPGDQFVRHGEKQASVSLELTDPSPISSVIHKVQWVKGSGTNKFSVDGQDYTRVGVKAPKPLQDLGFKDVVIGARLTDDGKLEGGETIRPQIARQFDRIFLLDESGSFLNEVLVGLSRLGVLQRAGRLCSSDLRQEKTLLKTREADLVAAEAQRLALAPVLDVRARVEALHARETALLPPQTRLGQLRMAWTLRQHWQARAAATVPPAGPRAVPDGSVVRALKPLLAERARLTRQVQTPVPTARVIPGATVALIRRGMALAPLVAARQTVAFELQAFRRGLDISDMAYETATTALQDLKTELGVCPVCGKPW